MNNLQMGIEQLRQKVDEAFHIVFDQFEDTLAYIASNDNLLPPKIIEREKKLNLLDNQIYRFSEDLLALYSPVAIDLRFILSSLRIGMELERIGDYLKGIQEVVISLQKPIPYNLIDKFNTIKALEVTYLMLKETYEGWKDANCSNISNIIQKDAKINEYHRKTPMIAEEEILNNPSQIQPVLVLTSISRKIERIGDHIKNICEEITFFVEAKIIRHTPPRSN